MTRTLAALLAALALVIGGCSLIPGFGLVGAVLRRSRRKLAACSFAGPSPDGSRNRHGGALPGTARGHVP